MLCFDLVAVVDRVFNLEASYQEIRLIHLLHAVLELRHLDLILNLSHPHFALGSVHYAQTMCFHLRLVPVLGGLQDGRFLIFKYVLIRNQLDALQEHIPRDACGLKQLLREPVKPLLFRLLILQDRVFVSLPVLVCKECPPLSPFKLHR